MPPDADPVAERFFSWAFGSHIRLVGLDSAGAERKSDLITSAVYFGTLLPANSAKAATS